MIRLLGALAVLGPALAGYAAPIPSDLVFGGEYLFDETGGSFVAAGGSQSGTMLARVGGSDTTVTYDGGAVTAGTNPLSAAFLEHGDGVAGGGDGFGGTGTGAAFFLLTSPDPDVYRADTDQTVSDGVTPFTVTNTSATTTYRVSMSLTYDHTVETTGLASFAESDLELDLDGASILDAKILSDTLEGNEKNGTDLPAFGGTVADAGVFGFDFVLAPGDASEMEIDYTLEGGVFFFDSTSSGSASYFLSIDDVTVVPEPGLFVLLGVGGLALSRRVARLDVM